MPGKMKNPIWTLTEGDGPIVATAIHDGHALRDDVAGLMALNDLERLREEDPFTGGWTEVAPTRVIGLNSRFEVDLNRPPDKAIYLKPEDAWGLNVFASPPSAKMTAATMKNYNAFYAEMKRLFNRLTKREGRFVVLDLHTYNHRRGGPGAKAAPESENPEVNIGTGTMKDRAQWAGVIDRFMADLSSFDYDRGRLDVRENVKFKGGQFARWIHETFPKSACVISVEFKKFFMDEWSGAPDPDQVGMISAALHSTIKGLKEALSASANG